MPVSAEHPAATSVDLSGVAFFQIKIQRLEDEVRGQLGESSVDLSWLHADVPPTLADAHVRLFEAKLEFVRRRKIITHEAFVRAQAEALAYGFGSSAAST